MITYLCRPAMKVEELFDGRLDAHGIREQVLEHPTGGLRCLTDGNERIVLSVDGNGTIERFIVEGDVKNADTPHFVSVLLLGFDRMMIICERQVDHFEDIATSSSVEYAEDYLDS